MKTLLSALAAVMLLGAVATATPAQAACWWNGYSWTCAGYYPYRYYRPWWRHHYYWRHHHYYRHYW